MGCWRGCVVAEGLSDPSIVNKCGVVGASITDEDKPIDYEGNKGRWHIYWIECERETIEEFRSCVVEGWYAHFWNEDSLLIVFSDRVFKVSRSDRLSWSEAIEHGKMQGIPEEELDFPTDETHDEVS